MRLEGFRDEYSINAPILDFTISEYLYDGFQAQAAAILRRWVISDSDNISRIRNVPIVRVPSTYMSNELPKDNWVEYMPVTTTVNDNLFQQFKKRFEYSLGFVGGELFRRKDPRGTALAMSLFRHLFSAWFLAFPQEARERWDAAGQVPAGVEELEKRLNEAMAATEKPKTDTGTPIAGGFVASAGSQVFHKSDCKSAAQISAKTLIHYNSRDEAIQAGKKPCAGCRP